MEFDLSLASILRVLCVVIFIKFLKWNFSYFYKVWNYSRMEGPPIIPYIGNFLTIDASYSEIFKNYVNMVNKYRHTKFFRFWLGPQPIVLFHKADSVDIVFNDAKFLDKSLEYRLVDPWLHTGLVTSGGDKWLHRRKLITPSFHFDILKDFASVINEQSEIFIEKLKKANKGDELALKPFISACSLDIICETAMGVHVNSQNGENTKYVQAVHKICDLLVQRMRTPYLWPDTVFRFSKIYNAQKETLEILHGFTRKVINERNDGFSGLSGVNKKRVAFLDTLLDARLKNSDSIDLDGIQEEVDTFMFEGHDTTTSALDWACFAIGTHPEVQKKLHEESDAVFGDSNRSVTQEDFSKMPYLECVIKESLRLYPPVNYIGREAKENVDIDGHTILKGTTAFVSILMIHRDEKYFPEPEAFKPERFLTENGEARHPFAYIPFSAGRRNCIGQRFAWLELKTMLVNILRNFSIECHQTFEELKPYSYIIFRTEVPIMVKLTERQK